MPRDRIVAVAKKMDAIGETADRAVAGIDDGEPQIAAVEAERREHAPHAAVRIEDVDRRRMGVLIVFGVVGVVQADRCQLRRECRRRFRQKDRGVARSDCRHRDALPASRVQR